MHMIIQSARAWGLSSSVPVSSWVHEPLRMQAAYKFGGDFFTLRQEHLVTWLWHTLILQHFLKDAGCIFLLPAAPCSAVLCCGPPRFSILAACRQPMPLPAGLVAHGTVVSWMQRSLYALQPLDVLGKFRLPPVFRGVPFGWDRGNTPEVAPPCSYHYHWHFMWSHVISCDLVSFLHRSEPVESVFSSH